MEPVTLGLIAIVGVGVAGALGLARRNRRQQAERQLADAIADARRWYERLGGQVLNLSGGDSAAARQALADAGERYNAAGGQLEQARTPAQAALAKQTAHEGLYYVAAARTALGLDPGPELPTAPGQERAGRVSENREVDVAGHRYAAAPQPTDQTTHYYPGGMVAGRPVPRGWYSEPFWKTALVAGAWGVGSALLFESLFGGMGGLGWGDGWGDGNGDHQAYADAADHGDTSDDGYTDDQSADGDAGYDSGGYDDGGSFDDGGGGFDGGFDGGDFGGGDF